MSTQFISLSQVMNSLPSQRDSTQFELTSLPPLSLYVHLPWCVKKCPYCDFNSHDIHQYNQANPQQENENVPEQRYIDALMADLEQELPKIWGRKVQSVFIGGGTPSLFSPEAIDRLLTEIRSRLFLIPQAEITLEANPGTVDNLKFQGFKQAGINRLSLGIQSFNDKSLKALGRIHSSATAKAAIQAAREAGFDNFNLDLMYGLPEQTVLQALQDLKTALSFHPTHISWYQLTIEANTLFHHQPPELMDDEASWETQTQGQALLAAHGFQQYEVSAYSQIKRQCHHNVNYWEFGDYIGIGAGAHGKISEAMHGTISRYSKQRHPRRYMETAHTPEVLSESRLLTQAEVCLEFMLFALRLKAGFPVDLFTAYTSLPFKLLEKTVNEGIERGLLSLENNHLKTTDTGFRFLNQVVAMFMQE